MTISVGWADEHHTIVQYTFDGAWTWDDWYAAYTEGIAMETSVTHRVDVILDARQGGRMPTNILLNVKKITDKRPANLGLCVVVTASATARTLYSVGCRFDHRFKKLYRLVDTPQQARRLIAEARLDDMKALSG